MITFNSTAGADGRTPATIEEALQERGWTVTRTFAGDLYLFAPSENGAATAEITPAPTAKESSAEEIDLQTLGKKLEAAGWKVERKSEALWNSARKKQQRQLPVKKSPLHHRLTSNGSRYRNNSMLQAGMQHVNLMAPWY